MNQPEEIIISIIQKQKDIIGSKALEQAQKINGLSIDWEKQKVQITGDKAEIINKLVEQYKIYFGQASVEVCKDAAHEILATMSINNIPSSLQ